MAYMSYCRNEGTLADLEDVWAHWDDEITNEYEITAKRALMGLILEMAEYFERQEND
jgi:hypothetical protein